MDNAARVLGGKGEVRHHHRLADRGEHDRLAEGDRGPYRAEKYPDITMAALRPCDDLQKKAFDETTTILNADPDVKLIMAICTPAVPGAAEAVKQSGRDDVKVIGLGLPNDNKPLCPRRDHRLHRPLEHRRPGLPDRRAPSRALADGNAKPGDQRVPGRPPRDARRSRGTTSCSASRSRSRRRISISSISEPRESPGP